jgi:predicted  nucleic acid-binding Zn-ribbon protein
MADDAMQMKHSLLLVTFLSAASFVAGCDQQPTASQQIDKAQAETAQAGADMKNYTYAEKADFVKAMQADLTALNLDLDKLSAKIDRSSDAVKADAKPKLQALRDQSAKLSDQLAAAQNATESTWDSVKDGTKKAYTSLQTSFTEARQWVSDKVAP